MKKLSIFLVFVLFLGLDSKSQNELNYKLGLYDSFSFGEYSPTGRFGLQITNNHDKDVFFLESIPYNTGSNEEIIYTCFVNEPFLVLKNDSKYSISHNMNLSVIDSFIDTTFSKAIKILSINKEASFDLKKEKRGIESTVVVVFKKDSIENVFVGNCEWKLNTSNMYWRLEIIPETAIIKTYKNKEIVNQTNYNYSNNDFYRQTFEWNNDSTEKTVRLFDINDKLVEKSIDEYNTNKKFIGHYSIDEFTSKKNIQKQIKYPSDAITEEITLSANIIVEKRVTEVNSKGDIIKTTVYEQDAFPTNNTLKISGKRFFKFEYDSNGKKIRYTSFNENNAPLTSIRYLYGKI